jgi:CPA2 family monovalent cation:H+ antiporter-2
VGEFSFVLAQVGLSTDSIGMDLYSLVLSTSIMTMVLTPFLSGLTTPLYALHKRWFKQEGLQTINLPQTGLQDHVVIAGGGRVGQYVAQVLQRLKLAFVLIELDYRRVEQAKAAGFPIIYGDASQPVVLEAARIEHARLALITTPAITSVHAIVERVRQLNPELHIVARASSVEVMEELHRLGVYEVVQPEFEAGLEITRQALLHLNIAATEIQRFTDTVRQELYAPLYETHTEYQTLAQLQNASRMLELTWVTLPPDSPLVGRTIQELAIRRKTGVSVVGVIQGGALHPNPEAAYCFASGDLVAIMGNQNQLAAFQALVYDVTISPQ